MKKNLFAFIAFVLFFAQPLFAAESLMMKIQSAQDSLKSLSAVFSQVNYDFLSGRERKAEGQFYYKRYGLMRWDYREPDEHLIIIGRFQVWLYDPILENVTIQNIDRVTGINSLDFFRGNRTLAEGFRQIQTKNSFLDQNFVSHQLFLSPLKPEKDMKELQLGVNESYRIQQLVVVDDRGNYRKITFQQVKWNEALKDELFEFEIKEGMEVISE